MLFRKSNESLLDRLEREANDDLRLLDELGPAQFGGEHLLELRGQVYERLALFQRRQRLAMLLGGLATAWVLLAILSYWFGYFWLSFTAITVATISLTAFFLLLVWQKKRFESKGELDYAQRIIEEELRRRAGKKPQRPRPF